ncbi:spermidine/putrescine transport system ATP-binding protein [Angulomicrobium tetraedrale]|uniref:Spermidine/putrescine transport system ATP-binding protein n=1 Tax=Ancylobacter tetraedralis TaxID=217068 RepID=A0A839ZHA7_9HYPH|nr:ABC transporter ATP-binding protein [Ancylobacter tetraedralis]MBB3773957.1 spermidine/putrescine transport system ATP-binding protein [Ancylobacter tetraedralis]
MRGKDVRLDKVSIRFGDSTAVQPTDLTIHAGEFFSILGPSGCGKTTILRTISGFIEPTDGRVLIGGEDMVGKGPNERPTALIFQNLALFPLMSVAENVAFGLEARGIGKAQRLKRAQELLELVALDQYGDKKPADLSGGQRQRVAIARALAVEPSVLLLDEPLSALDLKLRQHMRTELRAIQKRVGITFIYITHDQGEALAMSDRVAVMSRGRLEQVADADTLYAEPATPFVATFVGEQNVLRGRITTLADDVASVESPIGLVTGRAKGALKVGDEALVMVRPERISLGASNANTIPARLVSRNLEGPSVNLLCAAAGQNFTVTVPNGPAVRDLPEELNLSFGLADALVYPMGALAHG